MRGRFEVFPIARAQQYASICISGPRIPEVRASEPTNGFAHFPCLSGRRRLKDLSLRNSSKMISSIVSVLTDSAGEAAGGAEGKPGHPEAGFLEGVNGAMRRGETANQGANVRAPGARRGRSAGRQADECSTDHPRVDSWPVEADGGPPRPEHDAPIARCCDLEQHSG